MSAAWRLLIDDGPNEGAWNMALDRAVQLAHEEGEAPPTLRLYEWQRPTVTLGRFQAADSIDREFCSASGIDVVRRPTGGRGVLHADEVTYSIVAGLRDGVPRGTSASYRMLCGGLAEAYRLLGVDAALTARPRGSRSSAACYLHATAADLSLGARKLSGSAQVWFHDSVLQHGSFTISRDIATGGGGVSVVRRGAGASRDGMRSPSTACSLSHLAERPFATPWPREWQRALGVEVVPGVLTDAERRAGAGAARGVRGSRAAWNPRNQAQRWAEPEGPQPQFMRYNHT